MLQCTFALVDACVFPHSWLNWRSNNLLATTVELHACIPSFSSLLSPQRWPLRLPNKAGGSGSGRVIACRLFMWRGERRGIDNGPAVRQQGGGYVWVCVVRVSVCVRHWRGWWGYKQEAERPGAVWYSSGRLWGCIYCVCALMGGDECVFVCSIFQAGVLRVCSFMRTEFGFVCVNMSANLCLCVCLYACMHACEGPVVQHECTQWAAAVLRQHTE